MKRALPAVLLSVAALPASADEPLSVRSSRYTLAAPATVEPAPLHGGNFTLHGRFAPAASAGELRDGAHFTLIGRFAKAGPSCDFTAIFSDGFEGP